MSTSFLKKIVSVIELRQVSEDIKELHKLDKENLSHASGLVHDIDLMTKCLSHESILLWNIHIWAHFNGEKWDSVFAASIRKSEKFNKKMMDEYVWFSKNPKVGMKLYKMALHFAKQQNVEYINMNVIESHPLSEKVKNFYRKNGYIKDTETYIKKI